MLTKTAVIRSPSAASKTAEKPLLPASPLTVKSSAMTEDGTAVLIAHQDYNLISVWDVKAGNRTPAIKGVEHHLSVTAVCVVDGDTVRIFNLAGDLVRTLEKTDGTTSILEWDLQTRNRLPVGSGVYVYHVDAPGVGNTFGRIAVFMEKERLTTY